jgi:alpha-L-rhamnosidase
LNVTIPANTTATVYLPAVNIQSIKEGGRKLPAASGVKSFKMENDRAVIEIGSGHYDFVSRH